MGTTAHCTNKPNMHFGGVVRRHATTPLFIFCLAFFCCFLVHQANALAVVHQRATSPLWSKTSSIPSRAAALAPGLSPHPASRLPPSWTFFGPRTLFPPSKRPPRLSSMPSAHSSRLRLSCSRPKSKMSTRSTRIPRRPKWLCNLSTTSKKSKC
jgi:hypothetical protein